MTGSIALLRANASYYSKRYPEWWCIAISVASAAVMLEHGWRHLGHELAHRNPLLVELGNWGWMVAAMMLPFARPAIRHTAISVFPEQQTRSIALFLAGYLGAWTLLGLLVESVRESLEIRSFAAPALACAVSAAWLGTAAHRRALAKCHRTFPIAPTGWKSGRDSLAYGWNLGKACIGSCWPLMVFCALAGHGLVALGAGMAVGVAERQWYKPRMRLAYGSSIVASAYYLCMFVVFEGAGTVLAWQPPIAAATAPVSLTRERTDTLLEIAVGESIKVVTLRIEHIKSEIPAPSYDVYLALPKNASPDKYRRLQVGVMPMYGLEESTRAGNGLSYSFDISKLYSRLGRPRRIDVSFVPSQWSGDVKVRAERVAVYLD